MTFLQNGLFDSIISYKTNIGIKTLIKTGRSSIYNIFWLICFLTVARRCSKITKFKIFYIILVAATLFWTLYIKVTYEIRISWLIIVYIGKNKILLWTEIIKLVIILTWQPIKACKNACLIIYWNLCYYRFLHCT